MEFTLCPNPNADEPIILVNTKIGEGGITGTQFSTEIYGLCELGKKTITVSIASEGGNVFDGYAINGSMLDVQSQYGVKVITLNTGIAASIAGCFSQAGSWRVMLDYARIMLHNPFTSDGSEDKGLDSIRKSLITMISKRSGLSETKVEELLADTSWLNAQQALELGLVDEIRSTEKMDPKIKAEIVDKINYTAKLYSNKINIKNKYTMNKDFLKVLNDAGVKVEDNASEDDVMNAMTALLKPIADKVKSEDCNDAEAHFPGEPTMPGTVKNDADKAPMVDDKYNDLKKAYDLVVDELTKMRKVISDKAEADFNDKIDLFIKNGVESGRIQNSAIELCKSMAKADFNSFEKYLNFAPINKVAPVIVAKDFVDTAAKVANEVEIERVITGFNGAVHGASLLQNMTSKIMDDMNNAYNPNNLKK